MITKSFHYKILIISLSMLIGMSSFAQKIEFDSTQTIATVDTFQVVHSPKKAAIYSAICPGLGQAYNKKYWKIPLIYIGLGTMGYFIHWNGDHYHTMKQAYSDLVDDDETTTSYLDLEASDYYDLDNATSYSNFTSAVQDQMDYYRRNRDLLFVCIVGFYGLNIIDANVDAHLFDFDISEDLSFKWEPILDYNDKYLRTTYGVCCTFTF